MGDERKSLRERLGGWISDPVEVDNPTADDHCSMKRVVKSRCKTEEVEPGKFVRKCEKTEQLLRQCVGRSVEVVESDTEYSEEDVTHEMRTGTLPYESSDTEAFNFPGLRSDIEFLEQGILGGFSRFLEAAEDMRKEFFQALGGFPHDGEPRNRSARASDRLFDRESSGNLPPSNKNQAAYSDYAGKISDI